MPGLQGQRRGGPGFKPPSGGAACVARRFIAGRGRGIRNRPPEPPGHRRRDRLDAPAAVDLDHRAAAPPGARGEGAGDPVVALHPLREGALGVGAGGEEVAHPLPPLRIGAAAEGVARDQPDGASPAWARCRYDLTAVYARTTITRFDPQYPPESFPASAFGTPEPLPAPVDPFAGVAALARAGRVEALCFRPVHHALEYAALHARLEQLRAAAPRAEVRLWLRSALRAEAPFTLLPADRLERLTWRRGRGAVAAGVHRFLARCTSHAPDTACVLLAPPPGW